MKKVYKCESCDTIVTIVSEVHDLGSQITCACDQVMEWDGQE